MKRKTAKPDRVPDALGPATPPPSAPRHAPRVDIPPLDQETRAVLPTDIAAYHLNRSPQTLRVWACFDSGPIRPVRITSRLGWRTSDIRRLVEGIQ